MLGKEKQLAAVGGIKEQGLHIYVEMHIRVLHSGSRDEAKAQKSNPMGDVWSYRSFGSACCNTHLRQNQALPSASPPSVLGRSYGRKGENKWHLSHCNTIGWFGVHGGFSSVEAITDLSKTACRPQSSHHLSQVQTIQDKTSRAEKVLRSPPRFDHTDRTTTLWKNRCLCQVGAEIGNALPEPNAPAHTQQVPSPGRRPWPVANLTLLNAHGMSWRWKK